MGFEIDKISMPRVFAGPLQQDGTPPPPPPPAEENTFSDNGGINIVVLDTEGEGQIPHMNIIESIIQETVGDATNVNIEKKEGAKPPNWWDWIWHGDKSKMNIELENIIEKVEKGEDIDAVNISLASQVPFDLIKDIVDQYGDENINLTPENMPQHLEEVLIALNTAGINGATITQRNGAIVPLSEFAEVNRNIRELENRGVEVYVANGNKPPEYPELVNLFGLVPETTVVGALDENSAIAPYNGNSFLSDKYGPGKYNGLEGTSYATPWVLANDILAEVNRP